MTREAQMTPKANDKRLTAEAQMTPEGLMTIE